MSTMTRIIVKMMTPQSMTTQLQWLDLFDSLLLDGLLLQRQRRREISVSANTYARQHLPNHAALPVGEVFAPPSRPQQQLIAGEPTIAGRRR